MLRRWSFFACVTLSFYPPVELCSWLPSLWPKSFSVGSPRGRGRCLFCLFGVLRSCGIAPLMSKCSSKGVKHMPPCWILRLKSKSAYSADSVQLFWWGVWKQYSTVLSTPRLVSAHYFLCFLSLQLKSKKVSSCITSRESCHAVWRTWLLLLRMARPSKTWRGGSQSRAELQGQLGAQAVC